MLEGKVIVITGASSGIGLACASLFAKRGANLVLAARSIDKLKDLTEEIMLSPETPSTTEIVCVKADVSVEDDCKNLIDAAVEHFGRIDILINNAGVSMRALFSELDLRVIKRLMDVNFMGTVYCTKYALPYLLTSRGSVVGIISTAGFCGLPGRTGYSSSKYAIRGFMDTLRIEHRKDGLHVMTFTPGFTASNVRRSALTADGTPQGDTPRKEEKMMSADAVALKLEKAIERRRREVVLTPLAKAQITLYKLAPSLADRITYNFMSKEPDSPFK